MGSGEFPNNQMKCKIIAFIIYVFVRIDSVVAENMDGKNKLELLYLYIVKITISESPEEKRFPLCQ